MNETIDKIVFDPFRVGTGGCASPQGVTLGWNYSTPSAYTQFSHSLYCPRFRFRRHTHVAKLAQTQEHAETTQRRPFKPATDSPIFMGVIKHLPKKLHLNYVVNLF
jgi:hypothetical protein